MDDSNGQEKGNGTHIANGGKIPAVVVHPYPGRGTLDDPYIVDWDGDDDTGNPRRWSKLRRHVLTYQLALGTLCASFSSSAYSGGLAFMDSELHVSENVSILGLSFFVLGFGLGPLVFAPLSEMYGRRTVFLCTFAPFTLCHLGGALGHNIATILSTRLLAGIFGSSPITNAGGAVGDMWDPSERALPQALYSSAPFLGPILGPIVGGYISQTHGLGWRFTFWLMFIYSGVMFLAGIINMSETYAPFLLRQRARRLQEKSGGTIYYISITDKGRPLKSLRELLKMNLSRPFVFLTTEPIVLLLSIYSSLIYSILYAFFAAFPIVFQQERHFSAGEGGLAFLGIGLGNVIGMCLTPLQNVYYRRGAARSADGKAPPEVRLVMGCAGAILMPIGMFWFAWTSFPSVHYMVPIIAGIPFGTGMILVFIAIIGYILDTYAVFAASAIAANVVLRSVLAAVFPIFTPFMFRALGTQWAISVFAFLSTICAPLPFIFYHFGPRIRARSKYATALTEVKESSNQTPELEDPIDSERVLDKVGRGTDA